MSFQDDWKLPSVVGDIRTEAESSSSVFQKEKQQDWRKKNVISEDYSKYKAEFIDMFKPFQSLSDGQLGRISTMKHRVDLQSPAV